MLLLLLYAMPFLQADYPYPASFLGPMPGNPVKVATSDISNPNAAPASLLAQIRPIADVFYNYSGQAGACYNLTSLMPPGLQGDGWNVQSCGEMAMPIGQYGEWGTSHCGHCTLHCQTPCPASTIPCPQASVALCS